MWCERGRIDHKKAAEAAAREEKKKQGTTKN